MDNIEQQLSMLHTPNMDLSELEAEYEAKLRAIRDAFETLRQVLQDILEKFAEAAKALAEAFERFVWPRVRYVVDQLRRSVLYAKLQRWGFPRWLAYPIVERWPARWLPAL